MLPTIATAPDGRYSVVKVFRPPRLSRTLATVQLSRAELNWGGLNRRPIVLASCEPRLAAAINSQHEKLEPCVLFQVNRRHLGHCMKSKSYWYLRLYSASNKVCSHFYRFNFISCICVPNMTSSSTSSHRHTEPRRQVFGWLSSCTIEILINWQNIGFIRTSLL